MYKFTKLQINDNNYLPVISSCVFDTTNKTLHSVFSDGEETTEIAINSDSYTELTVQYYCQLLGQHLLSSEFALV